MRVTNRGEVTLQQALLVSGKAGREDDGVYFVVDVVGSDDPVCNETRPPPVRWRCWPCFTCATNP